MLIRQLRKLSTQYPAIASLFSSVLLFFLVPACTQIPSNLETSIEKKGFI
jgi:hypothetical protein